MTVSSCLMTVLGRVVVCFVLARVCVLIVTSAGSVSEPKPVFESCICVVCLVSPLCVACSVFRNISLCQFVLCDNKNDSLFSQQKIYEFAQNDM